MKYKGFTMVPDYIVQNEGGVAGLVYGKIARYCDWSKIDICTASNSRLAEELNLGESTVRKYKNILEENGYIKRTGKNGETDTVALVDDMVLGMPTPLGNSAPPARKQRGTPLGNSEEESIIKKEDKELDTVDAILAFSKKSQELDLSWMPPDLRSHLANFQREFYKDKEREPSKSERGRWVKDVREWVERGYKARDVVRAYKKCVKEETAIKAPASITWAFDNLSSSTSKATRFGRM